MPIKLHTFAPENLKINNMRNKKTKTWKLGESCRGGIITVEVTGNIVVIIGKDWDTSTGYNKKSNQSNAKEFTRGTIDAGSDDAYRKVSDFLCDLSTSYWSDQIIKWIETKVKLNSEWVW